MRKIAVDILNGMDTTFIRIFENKAKFTFVILRNPYLRIASAYLDMIVNKKPGMWSLIDNLEEKIIYHVS